MNVNSSKAGFNEDFPDFDSFCSSFKDSSFETTSDTNNTNNTNPFGNIDMNTILRIKQIMEKMNQNKNDPRSNLLISLKPYLKPSRKQKVDQYIQLFSMGSIMENFNFGGR